MLWLNETRPKLKEKYPDFGVAEIAKKAGEWWNKLDNQEEWKKKAAVLKEKYQEEMKIYNANKTDEWVGIVLAFGKARIAILGKSHSNFDVSLSIRQSLFLIQPVAT